MENAVASARRISLAEVYECATGTVAVASSDGRNSLLPSLSPTTENGGFDRLSSSSDFGWFKHAAANIVGLSNAEHRHFIMSCDRKLAAEVTDVLTTGNKRTVLVVPNESEETFLGFLEGVAQNSVIWTLPDASGRKPAVFAWCRLTGAVPIRTYIRTVTV